ncbi:hypothetical protein GCM10023184_03950 [Flaviaesturariibacter amylovorans]|uniref:DUF2199 domain-containing protein n=2 Tax=Flaviaesturariibacter amylovorans TaxID=1084520 RepID=A0ABP8G7Z8_9BACT
MDQKNIAELSSDFCVIRHEEQTDRFARAVLRQTVNDHCDDLEYGVWVSLSEKSFDDYYDHFDDQNYEATYFGYLCTLIPEYDDTNSIKTKVVLSAGGSRPEVVPHHGQGEHPFLHDYFNGISKAQAEQRIRYAMGED